MKIATAAILTPQVIVTSPEQPRMPSNSPFQYPPPTTVRNLNEKSNEKSVSPTKTANSALIHERDSQSNLSNVTEVKCRILT